MEFQLEHATEILRRTPATLNSLLRRLPEESALATEGPESSSAFDVVGHLIHGEEADWIPRANHPGVWRESDFEPLTATPCSEIEGSVLGDLLDIFERLRGESLKELEGMNLTPETLGRRGMLPELGAVTLGQLLSTWVVHDLGHIGQIVRVMAKQYGEAVGAWQAYLPVLRR